MLRAPAVSCPSRPPAIHGALTVFVAAAITLAAVACDPAPSQAPIDEPSVAPTEPAATTVRAYFFVGSAQDNAGLVPLQRAVPRLEPAGSTERAALEALIAGPSDAEQAAVPAISTVMPEGTRVLGLELGAGGVATVDLSSEFEAAGSANARGRLAQVVYTLTQFPTITDVHFSIAGKPITTFTDAQVPLDPPVDRSDFTDQLQGLFLDTPAWGAPLGNPGHLTGLADAFEAQFVVSIVDGSGKVELARRSVMAACGSGCYGTFDTTIPYSVSAVGPGRVRAYELSEVDGSPVNVTDYPVLLNP